MTLHKLLSQRILDIAFNVRMKASKLKFEIEVPDSEIEDSEESRVTLQYCLKVVDFIPVVIVTADGIEMLREPLEGEVKVAVKKIWETANWHVLNFVRMEENERVRTTERVEVQLRKLNSRN